MILAGDIGGTKSLLAIADASDGTPLHRRSYASADYADPAILLTSFLTESGVAANSISATCLAVAGPVVQSGTTQRTRITNLPWRIDGNQLATASGLDSLTLINDLVGCAHGIEHLAETAIETLKPGEIDPDQPRLIIGLGTGIGQALALPRRLSGAVLPSEAGHAGACAADATQADLLAAMRVRSAQGQVSVEQLLAGPAIAQLHATLHGMDARCVQTGYAIVAAADSGDPAALATLQQHASLLATHIRNMALTLIPGGGVYLTGGLLQAILPHLQRAEFAYRLVDSAAMNELLTRIPVFAVTDTDVGLTGAIHHACGLINGVR